MVKKAPRKKERPADKNTSRGLKKLHAKCANYKCCRIASQDPRAVRTCQLLSTNCQQEEADEAFYKALNGLAPRYVGPLTRVADLPGRRTLRSAGSNRLHIPPVRLSTIYRSTSHLLELYIHSVTG